MLGNLKIVKVNFEEKKIYKKMFKNKTQKQFIKDFLKVNS